MIDQCQFCVFGPKMLDKCEYYHLPEAMRGECCQYWDLFRRCGEEKASEAKKAVRAAFTTAPILARRAGSGDVITCSTQTRSAAAPWRPAQKRQLESRKSAQTLLTAR